jgi:hypothetical protein
MEQIFERLEAIMDAHHERMSATFRSGHEQMKAEMETSQEKMKTHHEVMMAKIDAWRGLTRACLEKESTPEETEAVAEPQEFREGATDEETIGTTEDRSRDLRLAVGCRGRFKTRTKRDGRVRQVYAATVGRPTRRFVPAMRKGVVPN